MDLCGKLTYSLR